MTFRRRITLASAAAVAVAVVLASLLTYLLTSNQLHSQVDSQLHNRGRSVGRLLFLLNARGVPASGVTGVKRFERTLRGLSPTYVQPPAGTSVVPTTGRQPGDLFGNLPPSPDQVRGYQQVVDASGAILVRSAATVSLPVDARTRHLAAGAGKPYFRNARVNGIHLRVLGEPLGRGLAVELAQPLTETDSTLARLRLILALIGIGGIALAALLGRLVAGAAVRPVKRLTEAAEHVAVTRDMSRRIDSTVDDEIGRMARSFNGMLDALERSMSALDASVHAQRQLVADASHELRTPVTSLRTNIEILQRSEDMPEDERRRLLSDVVEQIEELTLLMNDLIDLARGQEPPAHSEETRVDLLLREVIDRASRHSSAARFETKLEPTIVTGVPARLERAFSNLVDNAVKYSPAGEPIEIRLRGGELTVRDHGPGIPPEDLPHVFDRFYRGAEARGRPGSGLGLAIVRQVAEQQGGNVTAETAPGGGALLRLRLPGAETVDAGQADAVGLATG